MAIKDFQKREISTKSIILDKLSKNIEVFDIFTINFLVKSQVFNIQDHKFIK